jgi:hypothetical protein
MSEEPSDFQPDWKKITKLSEKLDKNIDEAIEDDMNFIEIDIAIYMVEEKLRQEKHRIMNKMETEETKENKGSDIYR